jgi:hypothetical protein
MRLDLGLAEPRGAGAAEVVRAHGVHAGANAGVVEVAADVAPRSEECPVLALCVAQGVLKERMGGTDHRHGALGRSGLGAA